MRWIVLYDIRNPRRLRRVARLMEGYGQRVQHSVFECDLGEAELNRLQDRLQNLMDPTEDRIHCFPLCGKDQARIRLLGIARTTPPPQAQFI